MSIIDYSNIGSSKDNMKSPVNNWYKFTAGFSYRFVDDVLDENPSENPVVFDPFSGCGTTLVTCQKRNIHAIGNEAQAFMCDIINAKLNWKLDKIVIKTYLSTFLKLLSESEYDDISHEFHPLLVSLYDAKTLKTIYGLRDAILDISDDEYRLFFKLALSQTLHKCCINPIAVPYIVRSKQLSNPGHAVTKFITIVNKMIQDIENLPCRERTSDVYMADSRYRNENIVDDTCDLCITSPPYLNNLDYGEISKVHTHFWKITNNWNDISTNVRSHLVIGATTHYKDSDFIFDKFCDGEFAQNNKSVISELIPLYERLKIAAKERSGKKSFHILMMYYFQDMYNVLKEIRRVLAPQGSAYLILGDSAPYGVYIQTSSFLGKIAQSVGFNDYEIYKLRERGTKWRSLSHRHDITLSENILLLH